VEELELHDIFWGVGWELLAVPLDEDDFEVLPDALEDVVELEFLHCRRRSRTLWVRRGELSGHRVDFKQVTESLL
jgi:hypothetical protein